jgi:competence protein ComEC
MPTRGAERSETRPAVEAREIRVPLARAAVPRAEDRLRPQAPLALVAAAIVAGIVVDRHFAILETAGWAAVGLAGVALAVAGLKLRWRGVAAAALVVALGALGGGRHHHRWSDLGPFDLSRWGWTEPGPAWIRGHLLDVPVYHASDPDDWTGQGRTRLVADATARCDGKAWHRATGGVVVDVTGDRRDLMMGQPIEVSGTMRAMPGPRNPGERDGRDLWRAEGVRLRMTSEAPGCVKVDERGTWRMWPALLGRMRVESRACLERALEADVLPFASALLLGRRETLDQEISEAFTRTGTVHIVAISGLHMQALAALMGGLFLAVGLGPRRTALAVMMCVIAYTLLVGARGSVVRSAAMTGVCCLGVICSRRAQPGNLLAAALVVTVMINPSSVFDLGCQLSYLAVGTLFWVVPSWLDRRTWSRWLGRWVWYAPWSEEEGRRLTPAGALDALEQRLAPRWKRGLLKAGSVVVLAMVSSVLVWLAVLPLVLLRLNVVPWVGIGLNVPLVLLSTVTLAAGGLVMGLSAVAAPLGKLVGVIGGHVFRANLGIVSWGGKLPGGSWYMASPGEWWVALFYVAGAAWVWSRAARWPVGWRRGASGLLAACVLVGAMVWLAPKRPAVLEADVLAVDHGLAVLVRSPAGRTLLYDCGRMRDEQVGRRVVAPALWNRGVRRVDCVVLSHADSDHYNGLADVLERLEVGEVRVPPGLMRLGDRGVIGVLTSCRRRGVPVRTIVAGDSLDLGSDVHVSVIHPEREWAPDAPDNARSVVLDVEANGSRVLLSGDLEGAGLDAVLRRRGKRFDCLLAPHHGGRTANPARLFEWARPELVVVSQRRPPPEAFDALAAVERSGVRVLRTWRDGAIRLRWEREGLRATGYLSAESEAR